ncbi:hypothetical protein B0A50_08492 [Salinomyces thailandicus]|uniref:Uncharacterized protein n=1 Tax=Salinomyces thailandicus TaxID=706561 RepID=A0A4U0TJL1_9PEZI|nr:hypothetical protein B0A50_08492 [Salinomyces thailandica]
MDPVIEKPYTLPSDATWLRSSSGIGRALAELIARQPNMRSIATARTPAILSYLPTNSPNILKLALDVTNP